MSAPSRRDLYLVGLATARTLRPDLTVLPGDVTEMELESGAAQADAVVGYAAGRFRATFLDGAQDDDLTERADDRESVQRKAATPAKVVASFSRPTSAAGAGTIAAGEVVATEKDEQGNEVKFATDAALVFGAAELGPKTVNATATVAGRDAGQNVAAAKVTRILGALWDSTIVVTNPNKAAGGNEEESDEALRERTRETPKTRAKATRDAIERGAREVDSVRTANAVEDGATHLITVYAADEDGNSNQPMLDAVEDELENWQAMGACVTVTGGVPRSQAIAVTVVARAGVDTVELAKQIRAAIVARVNRLRIGDKLEPSLIAAAAYSVDPDNIVLVTVTIPAVAVVPAANEVFRIDEDDVAVS
jgi:uncharacterized phage protein gp47/JayE